MKVRVGFAILFLPALHVPSFTYNLISVVKLAQKFNTTFTKNYACL